MNQRKRIAGLLTAALLTGMSGTTWAATDTIELRVTPQCSEAIVVSAAPEPYNFGSIGYALTTHSTRAISVSNTGSCTDSWDLQVADSAPEPWTAGAAAGADAYVLSAVFNSGTTQPDTSLFDVDDVIDDGAATTCTASKYDGDQTCLNVPTGGPGARNLWFKLALPLTSTDTAQDEHILTVTVTTTP